MSPVPRKLKFLLTASALLGGLAYLSYSGDRAAHPRWYQRAAQSVVAPIAQAFSSSAVYLKSLAQNYVLLRGARQQNASFQHETEQLKAELLRLQEENQSLRQAQGQYLQNGLSTAEAKLARVVGYDPSLVYRSITINGGSDDGLRNDQVVVAGGGVVGRILKTGSRMSQVLLVTDLHSSVDVLDARTRARGTLVGLRKQMALQREHWLTEAEYVSASEEIREGDLLLTSGQDGVFPKGLPIGIVAAVKKDSSGLFWQAEVEPYAELNKLEEVLVLNLKQEGG